MVTVLENSFLMSVFTMLLDLPLVQQKYLTDIVHNLWYSFMAVSLPMKFSIYFNSFVFNSCTGIERIESPGFKR